MHYNKNSAYSVENDIIYKFTLNTPLRNDNITTFYKQAKKSLLNIIMAF
jgi:hypothetical protein